MSFFKPVDAGAALEDLLDRERGAILDGNFEALARLAPEKARIVKGVPELRSRPSQLKILREKAIRNRQLLDAAGKGIRAASRQLRASEGPPAGLQTYDARGMCKRLGPAGGGELEKRT